jgi:hypothetical protein
LLAAAQTSAPTIPQGSQAIPPPPNISGVPGGASPSIGGVLGGGASPAQTGNVLGPTDPFDIANIVSKVAGLPQYQAPYHQLEDIQSREQGIIDQMQNLPIPKMGPQIQPGAGFLHNLEQGLLIAANMTRPGQAVNAAIYGPGVRQYRAQRGSLADQLQALREQEAIPTTELQSLQGLAQAGGNAAYRASMAGSRQETADAAMSRANTAALNATNKHSEALERIAQGGQKISIQQQQANLKDLAQFPHGDEHAIT